MCGMDVITQIRLLWLGGLGALYGVALGSVWLLGGWQHRREQRRLRLLERVRQQFTVELETGSPCKSAKSTACVADTLQQQG